MIHVKYFHKEIRTGGTVYVWVGKESFYEGNRLCWRCTFRAADGREIRRDYYTGRVLKDGELVIQESES